MARTTKRKKNNPHRNRVTIGKGALTIQRAKRLVDSKIQNLRYETQPKEVTLEKLAELDQLLELYWLLRGR